MTISRPISQPTFQIEGAPVIPPAPTTSITRTAAVNSPRFADVLHGSMGVVLGGAAMATAPVGGPLWSSAVRLKAAVTAVGGAASGSPAPGGALGAGTGSDGDMVSQMRQLQRESCDMNLELLALQEQIQQENRRFSTASNVLKARHETAKAAVGNIRS